MMTAVGMAHAGLGLTILPGSTGEIRAELGLLSKPIDDPSFTRPVSIIKRSGRTLPPLSKAFRSIQRGAGVGEPPPFASRAVLYAAARMAGRREMRSRPYAGLLGTLPVSRVATACPPAGDVHGRSLLRHFTSIQVVSFAQLAVIRQHRGERDRSTASPSASKHVRRSSPRFRSAAQPMSRGPTRRQEPLLAGIIHFRSA
jgi:LysR substrate binding domain